MIDTDLTDDDLKMLATCNNDIEVLKAWVLFTNRYNPALRHDPEAFKLAYVGPDMSVNGYVEKFIKQKYPTLWGELPFSHWLDYEAIYVDAVSELIKVDNYFFKQDILDLYT